MTIEPVRILLMEDDLGDVELIREGLRDAKIALTMAHVPDGQEGLLYLRRQGPYEAAPRPDIVLLDLNMPRKDGREVLREIRSDEHLRGLPVIVLTTSEAETDIVRSYDMGANCYVKKPLGLEDFLAVIKSIEGFWLTLVKLPGR